MSFYIRKLLILVMSIVMLYGCNSAGEGGGEEAAAAPSGGGGGSSNSAEVVLVPDPLYKHAWHLNNTGQASFSLLTATPGVDINYEHIRKNTSINGQGVKFAISDGGIDTDHPDLIANYRSTGSKNFLSSYPYNGTPIVSAETPDNRHGTSVAGIISAVGYNNIGSMGIAHKSTFGGFNFLAKGVTQDITKRLMQMNGEFDVFNYSYGPTHCFLISLGSDRTSYVNGLKNGVENLRDGKGAIYVKSGGNHFKISATAPLSNDGCGISGTWVENVRGNSTFDESGNYPYTIMTAAINAGGLKATYSSPGSNIWVSAPGGESAYDFDPTPYGIDLIEASPAIITTDIAGCGNGASRSDSKTNNFERGGTLNQNCDYTSSMNGTSSAAPIVSGVVGLILQANPDLTWRDVKHILASTTKLNDTFQGGYYHPDGYNLAGHVYQQAWVRNAAGYWFHNWYGFGTVDAKAAVEMASNYNTRLGLFLETNWAHSSGSIYKTIPDNSATGVTDTITVSNDIIIESVQLKITASHYTVENLGVELTSPSGTKSIILNINSGIFESNFINSIFASNAFYGESAQGNWTLKVIDGSYLDPDGGLGTTGVLTNWQLNFYGHDPDTTPPTYTTIAIDGGAYETISTSVSLSLSATGASEMYITNTAGCESGGAYEAYSTSKSWTLGQASGTATVYAKFKDLAGNESDCISDTIEWDSTPPTSTSIVINSGDTITDSTSATITLSAVGASQMYITNTAGCGSGGIYEAYSTSKSWTLGQTNGQATVYVKYKDLVGNESSCISDTIIHSNASVSINSEDTKTGTTNVSLSFTAPNASQMYVTNTPGCTSGGSYETYSSTKLWTINQTEGVTGVYVKFRYPSGSESYCIYDTILLDTTPPTSTDISINSGNTLTNSTSVTLNLSATDAQEMYITNTAGCESGGTYESYKTTKSWTLEQTNSNAIVYIKYKDDVGNESSCIGDAIEHDSIPPTSTSISINSGDTKTAQVSTTLTLAATDASEMYITNTAGCESGGAYETYSTSKTWTLGQTNSTASVYVKFKDLAGNESSCINDSIIHDSLPPSSTGISINSGASVTDSTSVTLALTATDASEMYVTNTAGCGSGGTYEAYSTSKSWTLGQTDSTATVYVKYKDELGNESTCINDTIEHTNDTPMIFTIETTTPNETFTLPFVSGYNYNVDVNWGDGTSNDVITSYNQAEATHTFSSAGNYTIEMSGLAQAWSFLGGGDRTKIKTVTQLGHLGWLNFNGAFYGCNKLTSFSSGATDTSSVTDMSFMFSNATSLSSMSLSTIDTSSVTTMRSMFTSLYSLASLDLSSFNTSNVTDMSYMFKYANSISNLNITGFNTSNVTAMNEMFFAASGLASLNVSSFNTSNVTNMEAMFLGTSGLTSLDLSSFDTSKVTNMQSMFYGASSLTSLDLSSFNTSNVTNMQAMFYKASGLTSLDLSSFDTSKVTNMQSMFYEASGLTSLDLSSFDTSNVTNMSQMFLKASALTSLDLSNFNTSNVATMDQMFYDASGLTSLDLSNFNTSNVTTMRAIFYKASGLTSLDLSSFDTSKVTNMQSMFYEASGLTSLDFSSFNTSNVTNMQSMFYGASSLTSLDLSSFNTSNVTNMQAMFYKASGLTSLDLSSFDTSKVTNIQSMFLGASSLTSLDLSSFNTSNVTNMQSMFYEASGLTSLDLSSFDTSKVTHMLYMFYGASSLTSLDLSSFNTSNVTNIYSMFYGASGLTSLDLSSFDTSKVTNMQSMFEGASSLTSLNLTGWDTRPDNGIRDLTLSYTGWLSNASNLNGIICNDPDSGGNGETGTGTVNGETCYYETPGEYTRAISGTVEVIDGFSTIIGTSTNFTGELSLGQKILIGTRIYEITSITNAIQLDVSPTPTSNDVVSGATVYRSNVGQASSPSR